mgnify:CR=1 FL=1
MHACHRAARVSSSSSSRRRSTMLARHSSRTNHASLSAIYRLRRSSPSAPARHRRQALSSGPLSSGGINVSTTHYHFQAHLHRRCQVFPRGEIYVSATHCHFQPTCTSDTRSFPLMARSTSRPLTVTSSPPTLPMSDSTVNLNHMRCFALRYSSRSHGMHLDEHQIASLPSTLVTCFASRFATRPHRTGCTSVHLYRQF